MCKKKTVKGAWDKHSAYVVHGMQPYSIDVGREEDWQSIICSMLQVWGSGCCAGRHSLLHMAPALALPLMFTKNKRFHP